jgi:hypothetical protein
MSPSRIPFLVVTCLMFSQGATAATAKAGPAAGTYATRDQLRECLSLDDGLKARTHALEAATVVHNRKFDASEAEGARLVDMKARLDHGDRAAIQAFNQAVQERNAHLQQMDEEALAADVATKALEADQAAVDQKCGPLTYRPADMDVVVKERKKATSASAPAS